MMAGLSATAAIAQSRPVPNPPAEWNYLCTRQNNAAGCVFSCLPNGPISSVFVAQVWLGTTDLGTGPAMTSYYHLIYYNGAEKVAGSGFAQSTRNLACQALGMKITYSGPPK
jgi:hypothetical protein